jgi:hypothetical protein
MLRMRSRRAVGFIEPCLPSPAKQPPAGPNWLHETKHDGFRNRSGRLAHWLKIKNPAAPAVTRPKRIGAADPWPRPLPAPRGLSRIGAALAVKNNTAQKLADVYFEDELSRGSAAKLLKVPTTATKAASTAATATAIKAAGAGRQQPHHQSRGHRGRRQSHHLWVQRCGSVQSSGWSDTTTQSPGGTGGVGTRIDRRTCNRHGEIFKF